VEGDSKEVKAIDMNREKEKENEISKERKRNI